VMMRDARASTHPRGFIRTTSPYRGAYPVIPCPAHLGQSAGVIRQHHGPVLGERL
jgi:hypothetical protein